LANFICTFRDKFSYTITSLNDKNASSTEPGKKFLQVLFYFLLGRCIFRKFRLWGKFSKRRNYKIESWGAATPHRAQKKSNFQRHKKINLPQFRVSQQLRATKINEAYVKKTLRRRHKGWKKIINNVQSGRGAPRFGTRARRSLVVQHSTKSRGAQPGAITRLRCRGHSGPFGVGSGKSCGAHRWKRLRLKRVGVMDGKSKTQTRRVMTAVKGWTKFGGGKNDFLWWLDLAGVTLD
jgi:hypothetical protein